jgi:hypothetical protein
MAGLINLESFADFFNKIGHSRPMHSVPVPINVRCYYSDIIVRRSEVTLGAAGIGARAASTKSH